MSKFQAISKWKLSFYKIIFIIFCDASQYISLGSCLCGRWKNVWNRRLATGRVLISRTLCSSQVESWLKAPHIVIRFKFTFCRFPVVWMAFTRYIDYDCSNTPVGGSQWFGWLKVAVLVLMIPRGHDVAATPCSGVRKWWLEIMMMVDLPRIWFMGSFSSSRSPPAEKILF